MSIYPLVCFNFKVDFSITGWTQADNRFQEVSGLEVSIEEKPLVMGGLPYDRKLPNKIKFSNLVLTRGVIRGGSSVLTWIEKAIYQQDFSPANILISLINEQEQPLMYWNVVNALPVKLKVSSLNALKSEVVVDTMEFSYEKFTRNGK